MSEEIGIIEKTGVKNDCELSVVEFWGGVRNGKMYQITQGIGGQDEPGFIQLTRKNIIELIDMLDLGDYGCFKLRL
ncbi:unnamed protein product [marine sediment metagenome]|uniref:Uncharacterized protein n=1 Tax=marine sediment metagenome TaxID=412755 RepID=X0Z649_9ZZZZ